MRMNVKCKVWWLFFFFLVKRAGKLTFVRLALLFSTARVGHTGLQAEEISDNVVATVKTMALKAPKVIMLAQDGRSRVCFSGEGGSH